MQIKLNLEKKEVVELTKSMEYLQQKTKTKTIRFCVLLFHKLSLKYDLLIQEKIILKNQVTQLKRKIKHLSS